MMIPAGTERLQAYLRSQKDQVDGWFSRIDSEIFGAILTLQNAAGLGGAGAEIGVHHGKSFIAICLALRPGECGYCIDIFGDQTLNLDRSGKGDRAKLESNLARFAISQDAVRIRQESSFNVRADEITAAVGPVRFFSVDGGHWEAIVRNDLALAEACLVPHGVIALDDFHRPEWPDVSAGYFAWYATRRKPLVPFAIGFNKLYLCEQSFTAVYQKGLADDPFLAAFRAKTVTFQGAELPVFNTAMVPEHGIKQRIRGNLKIFTPNLFDRLHRIKARLRRR
jgi:hypothetical protein